jgi:tRNA pseudouridine13 synthase
LNRAEVGDYVVSVERSGLPMIKTGRRAGTDTIAETNESIRTRRMRIAMPLVGIKQRISQGTMGQIEKQVLEAEGIKTEDFRIDAIPEISGRGELRTVMAPIENFKLRGVSATADNMKKHQAELEFMLLRGSYATVLLREIMKPRNPISAGF